MSKVIDFYFDVVCPFAYLASTQVEAKAAAVGATVRWRPVLLGGLLRANGRPDVPQEAMPANKAALNLRDIERSAQLLGVPLTLPEAHPRRTVNAMRCLVAVAPAKVPALAKALYEAYWLHGRDVASTSVLQELCEPFGLDVAALVADPEVREGLFAATRAAQEAGVFGVPSAVVDGQVFWGADRLHFAQQAVAGEPVREQPMPQIASGCTIELFHDFSSPFSYLGFTQIEALAARVGARLILTPILLGGLFRSIGTPMVPLLSFSPARQAWNRQDMEAWAQWHGVPFAFPTTFPLRTVSALRLALLYPSLTRSLYRAAWSEDLDVGDPQVLAGVLEGAGLDPAQAFERAADPMTKARLRENTERAEAVGVCGVPSFLVNGEELFWGQDRLGQVEQLCRGWPTPP